MRDILVYTLRLLKGRAARSVLTVLQVALGVWAVSLLISANIHVKDQIERAAAAYGQDLVVVTAAITEERDDGSLRTRSIPSFGLEDLRGLKDSSAVAGAYIAEPLGMTMNVAVDDQNYRLQGLLGVTEEFPRAAGLEIIHGDFFTSMDVQQGSPVILISESVARQLFPGESAVGRNLELASGLATMGVTNLARRGAASARRDYEIIGVFRDIDELQSAFVGVTHGIIPLGSQVSVTGVPSPTAASAQEAAGTGTSSGDGTGEGSGDGASRAEESVSTRAEREARLLPTGQAAAQLFSSITIQAVPGQVHTAASEARVLLQSQAGDADLMMEYIRDREGELFGTVNQTVYFLLAFGFIAMVISSVGILSVMMISVVERTRAIGLHRALGASRHWIRGQFLMESVLLSFVGAVIGIGFAAVSAQYVLADLLYQAFWQDLAATAATGLHVTAVWVSLLGAMAIGVIFGYFPAKEGSDLAPVDALRQG